jgi:hypothetical protein
VIGRGAAAVVAGELATGGCLRGFHSLGDIGTEGGGGSLVSSGGVGDLIGWIG